MKNHTDTAEPATEARPAREHSLREQKLARALRRNLARRKTVVHVAETGADR